MIRQNQVIVDLKAIEHNYRLMRDSAKVRVMAVVKADAYGHGLVEVAQTVEKAGATDLAVAIPEEGVTLREHGLRSQILVLGAATKAALGPAVQFDLTQTVFEPETVEALEQTAVRLHKDALVHIKLDTGMGRIGLRTDEEAEALAHALAKAPHVKATGIFTHFADADNLNEIGSINAFTQEQLERFASLRAHFDPSIPAHVSNSAMSLVDPDANFSMIREGISLYGYPPVPTALPFRPALRWQTEVVHIKELPCGQSVGYGRTFTTDHPMRVATIAVGYGDGYHSALSNRGQVLICGKRARIVGRVCMDQTMVDVTDIPDVTVGSTVTLIGAQGNDFIGADELARHADTISYEVLLSITRRVPRTFQ